MNIKFIYLGDDQDSISIFKKYLNSDLFVAKHRVEVLRIISNFNTKKKDTPIPVILLQKDFLVDFARVSSIKTFFPNTFIILVTEKLNKDESAYYLKLGVNNTISPHPDEEAIEDCRLFISQYYRIVNTPLLFQDNINIFILPKWKRFFDIVISFIGILCLSPIFLIVSIVIILEDGLPVFYKAKRVGSNFHIFDFWKFRSMYKNADQRVKDLQKLNQYSSFDISDEKTDELIPQEIDPNKIDLNDTSILFDDNFVIDDSIIRKEHEKLQNEAFKKFIDDPRITKIGKFIRKYSIDELPQLYNILKGDMSIVGNRPLPLYEAELLTSDKDIDRFLAPAGLTGLWQIEKRGGDKKMSPEERKELDITYGKTFSFLLDLKIILKTFTSFIQKEDV